MILLKAFHQLLNYLLMINLFSVANDINASADQMNKDLKNMSIWVYHWKMYCNLTYPNRFRKLPSQRKIEKNSASMHSLSVLRFLCETFSKLLKLAL